MKEETNNNIQKRKGIFHSWEIVSDKVAIKKTDKSFFKYHGSGIPKKTKWFWEVDNLIGGAKYIKLEYHNRKYDAHFEVLNRPSKQVRIFWSLELHDIFQEEFPPSSLWDKPTYPCLRVVKKDHELYEIDFLPFNISDYIEGIDEETENAIEITGMTEGQKKEYLTTRYERNQKNREACIKIHGLKCFACGFDFEQIYGLLGQGFIEVHHRDQLSDQKKEVIINPETDLVPLCSNCHRMIHRQKNNNLKVEELKRIIKETKEKIK